MTSDETMALLTTAGPGDPAAQATAGENAAESTLPSGAMPILPVRNLVLFPGLVVPITIGRPDSIAAAQEAARNEKPLGVVAQKDPAMATPGPEDLFRIGTVGNVLRYLTAPDGSHHVICQGAQRFRVLEFLEGQPYLAARIERIAEPEDASAEVEALRLQLRQQATRVLELLPQAPPELTRTVATLEAPGMLADLVASFLDLPLAERQEVLETIELKPRLERVLALVNHQVRVLSLSREIGEKAKESLDERQREFILREQMRQIQQQLGEADEKAAEIAEVEAAIKKAGMPDEVEQHARKELKRLERMPEASAEFSMQRTYLDWLTELPWSTSSAESIDIARARTILDADHHGLEKVKRRILEYLAVRKLAPESKGPILCFVGPPGVGKTSLGKSIARATGRKFARASLGGLHDEAEIRGHRRTYIGAMPGIILQQLRRAGTNDCVLMLDEIDKTGAGIQGDPSAALLEVLDPEQNNSFRDNYLGVPFDLSRVMFIATANVLDAIPGPLRDRMEVIELPGYTEEEKLEIARRYLVARQLTANGLTPEMCRFEEAALRAIIRDYTREAGVRTLERQIGAVCRRVAMRIAEGEASHVDVDVATVRDILGPARFESEVALRVSVPGVATGLAWTPVGGDILFIEATRAPGSGKLILTGQLGDVMKESAQAALSLIKSKAATFGIDIGLFEKHDLHIHVPAGAIPKDGPSAGVTMFTALLSLFTNRPVRPDVAMTGEISLRGLVLPVGGIKEKVVAAAGAGITTVLLPARNRRDLPDIPASARDKLTFHWLETVEDAAHLAFGEGEAASSPETAPAPLAAAPSSE